MTLSAWIRPSGQRSGWRTIVHRQTDAYFLDAGSDREIRAAALEDVRVLLIGSALWLCIGWALDRGRWAEGLRHRWWPW